MKITESKNIKWDKVKNLLFDLGGVIVNINYQRTVDAFQDLGIGNFKDHYTQHEVSDLFIKYETGKLSSKVLREELKKATPEPITDKQIDTAWCSMLLDTPVDNLKLLKFLKDKYNMYLLSNTNQIHIDYYLNKVKAEHKVYLPDYFDKMFYSHEVKMRKPNAEIFEFVQNNASINLGETLYIDDTEMHIDTAAEMGFQAFFLKNGMTIHDVFTIESELIVNS